MELRALGFDDWFQDKKNEAQRPDCHVARVTAVDRESCLVKNEHREVFAEPAGRFVYSVVSSADLPSVGDWVLVQYHNDETFAIIHGLLPRKTFLRRKTAGNKIDYQMIAANIDTALIVQACDHDFNVRRLERYLVMVQEGQVEPILLLTKSDLISQEMLEQRISAVRQARIQCRILPVSTVTGLGVDQLRQVLQPGKTYCLVGSSGVGKTTLLNTILGRDFFETNTVRPHDGKGRHTTARRQLIVLEQGAMLIDTPGMRELGNIGVSAGLEESFSDILSLSKNCRFANCTHTQVTGCALLAAIENGSLRADRYQSYLKLMKEAEYHDLSYGEKRRRDRNFGKFLKIAMKQIKKSEE